MRECVNTCVCDVRTLHKPDPLEFWKMSEPHDRVICEEVAAAEVDVANSIARRDEALDAVVGDEAAVPQVEKVQVLTELRDGVDGNVGEVPTLLQHEVPDPWCSLYDPFNRAVCDPHGQAEIEDAQMVVGLEGRKRKEGGVVNQIATSQAELAKRVAFGEECRDRFVADKPALLQVDLEDIRAIFGKRDDSLVLKLGAIVEFELRSKRSVRRMPVSGRRGKYRGGPTLLIYLHCRASWIKLSLEMRVQPDMFRP